jgi:polar amino acid transport system substrate-binding protein
MLLRITVSFIIILLNQPIYASANDSTKADLLAVASPHHLLQYQEQGENKGPTIEILNALLNEAELKTKVSFMPWARAFSTAKNNPNTLILSMIRTSEREDYFHWLIKVSQSARIFISLKNKPENFVGNVEQAKKKLIAVVIGSAGYNELILQGFSEKNNLYMVSNDDQMVKLLASGRVDLVYGDPNNIENILQKNDMSGIIIDYRKIVPENQRVSYIAINKNSNKRLLSQLQQAANTFSKTAEYSRLLAK